ncbi:unnamed protein product, partial [Laminaria digitata]
CLLLPAGTLRGRVRDHRPRGRQSVLHSSFCKEPDGGMGRGLADHASVHDPDERARGARYRRCSCHWAQCSHGNLVGRSFFVERRRSSFIPHRGVHLGTYRQLERVDFRTGKRSFLKTLTDVSKPHGVSFTTAFRTSGGADGSFTLAFGDVDYPLPGTVDVVNGEDYIVTSQDLTPYIKRGDRISALGWEYVVHAFRPFNATHLYLAKGTTAAGTTLFHAMTTPEIAHDASAAEVKELLETLPSLGQV